MAPVFDYNDIKIDFVSKHLENSSEKYIANTIVYPVFRYKILAPVIEDLQLNIFQKSILSLLNKGNYDVQTIANWLKLDTQLVKMIISELNIKGFLNQNIITKPGREIIENTFSWFDSADSFRKDIYYIYQDIFTSKLYPVILKIDPANHFWEYEKGKIHFKSKGGNRNIYATLIEPRSVNHSHLTPPETSEIFEAIKKYSKIGHEKDDKTPLNLIQYLGNSPTLSYLSTTLYMHRDGTGFDDIRVLDPFGNEEDAYWLRDSLIVASRKNYKLKEIIDEMVLSTHVSINERLSEALREIHNKAVGKADILLGDEKTRYKDLYRSIIDLYKDFLLYESHKEGKYLKEAFKNSQTVLETLFEYIYNEYRAGYEILNADRRLNNTDSDVIEKKALYINKEIIIPKWGFKNIAGVYDVLQNKNSSLRPKYIAALLASQYDEKNPMHLLLKKKNDLLVFLEKVSTGRNRVGHKYVEIPNSKIGTYYDEVVAVRSGVEEIIKIFLGEK